MKKTIDQPAIKAEIIARLSSLEVGARPLWGKMSAHQMICHLSDSHRLPMGEMKTGFKSSILSRTVMKWGALRAPIQWPKGLPTVPEIDQAAGSGTPPAVFEADRARLLLLIERFTAQPRDFQFAPHPMFAQMTEWEWMRWAYLHADHHLRQFEV